MVQPTEKKAWVTLLTVPGYLPGAIVLDSSLKSVGSKYPLVVMVSPDLPKEVREVLALRGLETVEVGKLMARAQNPAIKEERFRETWTKLKCFEITHYKRVVLLDSDMLVRQNMDELMEMPLEDDWIAAAHACACNPRKFAHYPSDWIPENCAYTNPEHPPTIREDSPRPYGLLNSGLVVLNSSADLARDIERFMNEDPRVAKFQFPDQDLLATYFEGRWKPLSYKYNALKTLRMIHKPLWRDGEVKNIHYILQDKPWTYRARRGEPPKSDYHDVDLWWWDTYESIGAELETHGTDESKRAWEYLQSHVAQN